MESFQQKVEDMESMGYPEVRQAFGEDGNNSSGSNGHGKLAVEILSYKRRRLLF